MKQLGEIPLEHIYKGLPVLMSYKNKYYNAKVISGCDDATNHKVRVCPTCKSHYEKEQLIIIEIEEGGWKVFGKTWSVLGYERKIPVAKSGVKIFVLDT